MTLIITRSRVLAGRTAVLVGTVTEEDETTLLTAAAVSALTYTITDVTGGAVVSGHDQVSLTPSDCFHTADSDGYNFLHVPADGSGEPFPTAGHLYRVEYVATPADGGEEIAWRYELRAI
jgi:hypothetical protein